MIFINGHQPSNRVIDSDYITKSESRYAGKQYEVCKYCFCSKVKDNNPFCRKHRDLRKRK